MTLERLERWRLHRWPERFQQAFEWLEGRDWAQTPVGRFPIDGDRVYAVVAEYATKASGPLEVHRRYADVQFVAQGEETLGWSNREDHAGEGPYDAERDIQFLKGRGVRLPLAEGWFAVLLPGEPHAPGLDPKNGTTAVLKAVVKVLWD
ncbi:MAG: YhcH/YjgK/YiaL family protein [Fimbriimonadales bacterium]|nr:YhcH/YjgK/YiaL family protein [Fimbriimonadales bacterium]